MSNMGIPSEIEVIDEIISVRSVKTMRYTLARESSGGFSITVADGKDSLTARDISRDEQRAIELFERIALGRVGLLTFFEVMDDFLAED